MKLHTKSDFTALMHRFLDPLLPLYSKGGARLHLGDTGVTYPGRTIEMEAFSRPLWALAPFWTGGGRADDFLRIYRKGLASGTDPESPEYWGDPNDYDQLFVEMAALACAILETPESVWEPLTDAEKANLAKWLDTINHHDLPGCNWLLFRVLVNLALDSVGMPCDMARAAADMAEVDNGTSPTAGTPTARQTSSPRRITTTPGPSSITPCSTACLPLRATPPARRSTGTARPSLASSLRAGSMKTARRCLLAAA